HIYFSPENSIVFNSATFTAPQRNELLVVIAYVVVDPKVFVRRTFQDIAPRYFQETLIIPGVVMVNGNVFLWDSGVVNFNRPSVGTSAVAVRAPGDTRIYGAVVKDPVAAYF